MQGAPSPDQPPGQPPEPAPPAAAPPLASPPPGEPPAFASPYAAARSQAAARQAEDEELSRSLVRAPLLRTLLRVPLKKITIWLAFLLLLWVLRPFFGLVFLTFVLSYISFSIVERVSPHFTSRKVPVVLVFAGIVGAVVALGFATIPKAVRQGREQLRRLSGIEDPKHIIDLRLAQALGGQPVVEGAAAVQGGAFGAVFGSAARRGEVGGIMQTVVQRLSEPGVDEVVAQTLSSVRKDWLIYYLQRLLEQIWVGVVFTLMALLFSFMIVWDAPRIGDGIARLRESRLGDIYTEVAPSIATFARLLGRAFEAQTAIALVNTSLTAIAMAALGLNGIGLLSLTVFLCSFVPIAGVFISTLPMCIVALTQADGGLGLAIAMVVMVTLVHILEAYVLNPRIYGHHMKLHPLAVLVVLYLGQHLFGLWGLIIGVPVATYVWRHVVMGEVEHIQVPAPLIVPAPPAPGA